MRKQRRQPPQIPEDNQTKRKPPSTSRRKPSCSCGSGSGADVSRRAFLKAAGAASISGLAPTVMAQSHRDLAGEERIQHYVPANKHLEPRWVRKLFARGNRRVYRGKALDTIGMPVNGIATGQLYLRGDGTLGIWQIFNRRHFTGVGEHCYKPRTPDAPVDQGFAVTVRAEGKTVIRELDRSGFPEIEFSGEYPIGTVRYQRPGFPVQVEMEVFSPFIPLNAKDSALPATLLHITVENVSEGNLRAGVLGWLENAVCFHSAQEVGGLRRSRLATEKGRTLLIHSAEESPEEAKRKIREAILLMDFEGENYADWTTTGEAFGDAPAQGTFPDQSEVKGFLGKGFVNTYLGGDAAQGTLTSPPFTISRRLVNFLIGGGDHPGETCINLLVDGRVVRTATGKNNEQLVWNTWNVEDFEGCEARIEIVDRHSEGWGHINIDHIELSDERRQGPSGPLNQLEDYGTMVLAFEGEGLPGRKTQDILDATEELGSKLNVLDDRSYPIPEKVKAAFHTRMMNLSRGEKHTFVFVLAWHFPNHEHGHEYARHFPNASKVVHYVLDNHERLTGDTRKWHDTYYDSTLPYWLLDRLHSTVSTLATGTCQWWRNGRFWAWEGVGCCHGTCTHVWNYAQAHARLFPELARSVREMQDFGAGFHPETGLVGFRGRYAYAADGQCGTILKAYREHQMSADDSFLKCNWPKIKKALEFSIEQDGNADGLIENTQHNTYDINFEGPNTFVGALYLAALRAAEEMAREADDAEFVEKVSKIREQGTRHSVDRLWGGEYFIQDVDLVKFPKHQYGLGCLSDQMFGQAWAHQLHLGYLYPKAYVELALMSVWKYNWAPDVTPQNKVHQPWRWFVDPGEGGLFVCTWPKSRHLEEGVTYQNEVWTGIEYQVAGHMIWEGMVLEALAIIRAVDDRYHPLKRNPWNEVECGDHYARALASWGVLLALGGYEYHGPKGHLGFSPRITPEDFRVAFTAAEGWGTFAQSRRDGVQREVIEVRWGRLRLKTLAFSLPEERSPAQVSVMAAGETADVQTEFDAGRLDVSLLREVTLNEGESLEVAISLEK